MPGSKSIRWRSSCAVAAAIAATIAVGIALRPSRPDPVEPEVRDRPPADAVARVGDVFITAESLGAAATRGGLSGASNALQALVRRELYFQEAQRTGFAEREEVLSAWRAFLANRFEEESRVARAPAAPISEAEMAGFYEANPQKFLSAERRRLAVIFVASAVSPDPARRAALETRVHGLHEQAVTAAARTPGFGELAARNSEHRPSRLAGGDVGWMTLAQAQRAWPDAVARAAFALSHPGEISPPIPSEEGWHLLKLVEVEPAHLQPLDEVRDHIRYELGRAREAEADEARLAELRARHPVEVYGDRLARVSPLVAPAAAQTRIAARPPSLPAP